MVEASFTIAVVNWTFEVIEEQVSVQGRLAIAVEVHNEQRTRRTRGSTGPATRKAGFIPPDTAIYEAGVEVAPVGNQRLPPQSSFTIQAGSNFPQNEANSGTVYINTTVHEPHRHAVRARHR